MQLQMVTYTLRDCVGELPFGSGAKDLVYLPGDPGGGDAPTQLLVLPDSSLWLRQANSGQVYLASFRAGRRAQLDFDRHAPDELRGWSLTSLGLTLSPERSVVVLVVATKLGERNLRYALMYFDQRGDFREALPLPALDARRDVPTGISVDAARKTWVHYANSTLILSPEGTVIKLLSVPGVLTPDGFFVSSEEKPRLFDANGSELGPLVGLEDSFYGRWLRAGPQGLLFAWNAHQETPEELEEQLEILNVYVLDRNTREIALDERIVWPAERLVPPKPGELEDGLPVASSFPSESLTLDEQGNVYILEHTPEKCRFHRYRILRGPRANWRQKFEHLDDLSEAELRLHRAEYEFRIGIGNASLPIAPLFQECRWHQSVKPAGDADAVRKNEPALQKLYQAKAARP